MLKVLIADDEPSHRLGLIKHVHWEGLGYDTPLLAEDAEEALFLTQKNRIDVLIADVCMPGMDGIELVKEMRTRYPDVCVLIVSGYEEFEFARAAVEAGAKAYLLKPLKIDEVERWLQKFHEEIRMAEQLNEADLSMKKKLQGSLQIARERFLEELLEDAYEAELINQRVRLLDLPSRDFHFRLAVLSIDDYNALLEKEPETGSTVIYRLMKMIETAFADFYTVTVKMGLNRVIVLLSMRPGEGHDCADELNTRFGIIKKSLAEMQSASITVCISGEGSHWMQVHRLYKECSHLLNAGQCYEKGLIFRTENTKWEDYGYDITEINEKVTQYIGAMNDTAIQKLITEVFNRFQAEEKFTLSFIQSFSLGVISELAKKAELIGFQMDQPYTGYCRRILSCVSPDEIRDAALEIVSTYFHTLADYQNQKKSKVIEIAEKYIREHLEEDTTVKELSEIVHMNSSYLSVLFKKEMGETITEFVNRIRIEKAKSLLQQGFKVTDIAQRVGYQNPSYFANQFKKAVGYTPAEYRKFVL